MEQYIMEELQKVLLVINDLTDTEVQQIQHFITNLPQPNLELHLLFVQPEIPSVYFAIESMTKLAAQYKNDAHATLKTLGEKFNVLADNQWFATGKLSTQAKKIAQQLNASLVLAADLNEPAIHQHTFFQNKPQDPMIQKVGYLFTGATLMPLV